MMRLSHQEVDLAEFVWQNEDWQSRLHWDSTRLATALAEARRRQGRLQGKADGVGFDPPAQMLVAVVDEAVSTTAIEGERLDRDSVRSSVARHLGLSGGGLPTSERGVDGLVELLLDATVRSGEPLTAERLKGWHAGLFPSGFSGIRRITVGEWRQGPEPMRVVSGMLGDAPRIHFEAVPPASVEREMQMFLGWFDQAEASVDGMIRAGVAHFRLLTVHPFDDGNGRITRAVTDLALARDEGTNTRLWSFSAQILQERDTYYEVLERAQRGDGDLTDWLTWFLGAAARALARAEVQVDQVLAKARFWDQHRNRPVNARQRKALNRMLDAGPGGFVGGMTTRKYVSLVRTSRATAQRDLAQLVNWGLLVLRDGGGRSTSYDLAIEPR
jgi:Fic family protein